jgi:hypothetical protein
MLVESRILGLGRYLQHVLRRAVIKDRAIRERRGDLDENQRLPSFFRPATAGRNALARFRMKQRMFQCETVET